jgi:hypothetical protein
MPGLEETCGSLPKIHTKGEGRVPKQGDARCNDKACTGGNETRTPVDTSGDVGTYASVVIGLDAKHVVAYYDATNTDLKLAPLQRRSLRRRERECRDARQLGTLDSAPRSRSAWTEFRWWAISTRRITR